MEPWFIWGNRNSRDMGIWVTKLPARTRPEERVQRVTIPGKAGFLTVKEGDDVCEGYLNECVVTAPYDADFPRLLRWLWGKGTVVFSDDPEYCYQADIAGAVKFDRIDNCFKQATIPFYFQPFKRRTVPDSPITFTSASGTLTKDIFNPGDVASAPIVTITYTGSVEVEIGDYSMAFTSLSSSTPITIDCGAEIITKANGDMWDGSYSGDFWRIPAGNSTLTVNKTGVAFSIRPEWRWK